MADVAREVGCLLRTVKWVMAGNGTREERQTRWCPGNRRRSARSVVASPIAPTLMPSEWVHAIRQRSDARLERRLAAFELHPEEGVEGVCRSEDSLAIEPVCA
jgi:hypothetical protein